MPRPRVALPPAAALEAEVGIVHLGLGAFHRAHQAILTQRALAHACGPWAISGVSLRGAAVRDALRPQDCLYSVIENDGVDGGGERRRGGPRGAVRARRKAGRARPARGAGDPDRHAHRHREGLLPQPGDRRSRPRPSRHPGPTSRGRARRARPSAGSCAGWRGRRAAGERRAHRALLRQHGEQRPHAAPSRRSVRQRVRARARRLDRGPGPLPEQHGRPDRPGRHAGLARPRGGAPRPAGRGGGQPPKASASG